MGVGIVAAINGIEVVQVVAIFWHKTLEIGLHIFKEPLLFFVDVDKGGRVAADDGYLPPFKP